MTDQTTYQRLAAPFELADHAKVPKGGMTQTYAPWTAYVERLNEVLPNQWSFRVVREGFTETECWVLGEITALIDGEIVTRQQYGCEAIVKGRDRTPTTDLLKTAASDAIKKATQLIGPGLYLSKKEEREAIDAALREEAVRLAAEMAEAKRNSSKPKAEPPTAAPIQIEAGAATGAPEPLQQRWRRLVAEAERVTLPTLGQVKAIDPKAVSVPQLELYAQRLEERLYEAREAAGVA
jgi:hypothetical protein